MKKILLGLTVVLSLIAILTLIVLNSGVARGAGSFAQTLPNFSLQDPVGKTFTKASLSKDGLVLVVTAPILSGESAQKGWDRFLSKSKAGSMAKWVYVEDMQPSLFKAQAMNGMKKDYVSGREPILLIDTNGALRRALGVSVKSTVVLVYNSDGQLVHSETGQPSSKAAEAVWKK